MRAGRLNSEITIQQLVSGQDEAGQPVNTWETFATAWANIRHLSGMETIKAGAETSVVKASISIRYLDGVRAAMRVVCGSTTYEIKAVLPDMQRSAYLEPGRVGPRRRR